MKEIDSIRLKRIARHQKNVLICLLILILDMALNFYIFYLNYGAETLDWMPFPDSVNAIMMLVWWITIITAIVSMFFLISNVYNSTFVAGILAILMLAPCFNIIVIFGVSQMASKILRDNGIKVGFLGARMSQFNQFQNHTYEQLRRYKSQQTQTSCNTSTHSTYLHCFTDGLCCIAFVYCQRVFQKRYVVDHATSSNTEPDFTCTKLASAYCCCLFNRLTFMAYVQKFADSYISPSCNSRTIRNVLLYSNYQYLYFDLCLLPCNEAFES